MSTGRFQSVLDINIPEAPAIARGADTRTIAIALVDHINVITHAMQAIVRSHAELTGIVMGFDHKLDEAIGKAVRAAQESVPDLLEQTMDTKELAKRRARDAFIAKVGGKAVIAIVTYVAAAAAGGIVWEILHHVALK
jgi:hypothetical protein